MEQTAPLIQEETYAYTYEEHHTPLACAFHSRLEAFKYTEYYSLPFDSRIVGDVYCKIKLPKVAKQKWTLLHVQIGHNCKTWQPGSQERCSA